MRVLLVTANFRPSVGGIERFVEILAGGLAERGHAVTVATCRTRGAPATEHSEGVRVVRIRASDRPRERLGVPYPIPEPIDAVRTLRALLRDADVVHAQDALYLTTVASLLLARRLGVPSVLTQHVAFVPQGRASLDLAQRAAIATLGRCGRLADVVTTVNPSVADWARRTWGLRDVRPLPVGVPVSATTEDERTTARRDLGIDDRAFVALFAGRDVPKKRLDLFAAASDPAYELIAVTDRRETTSGVRLLPFTSPERFRRLLAAADAFVLPSEGEGLPLTLQEALVAGLPCVVTREPGYERFLTEDDVLFVAPDARAIREALLRLESDPAHRRQFAERARRTGRRSFTVDAFVDAYQLLYEATSRTRARREIKPQRSAHD